jgi:membrane-associated phospholipid phosphatase
MGGDDTGRGDGHPCAVAFAVFFATHFAYWQLVREVVSDSSAASPAIMLHPMSGWVALAFVSPILLLGRNLSAGGVLAGVSSRWRHVHVSRLPANSHVCVQIQRLRHPVLDMICRAFGFCAEEDFYMILAPVCWWIFPFLQPFFFNLMLVALFGLLVGDALKDMLYIPRPSHPLLWTHSHSKGTAQEYGMPSTHAMNAVSNSLIFCLCARGECGEHAAMDLHQSALTSLASVWVLGICISRLYLGVRYQFSLQVAFRARPPAQR